MKDKRLSKRNIIINVAIIIFVALLSFIYLTKSKVITLDSVKAVKWTHVLIVLGLFILAYAVVSLLDLFVYRRFTDRMNYPRCFANSLTGNLGSGITPFKSGHFPLMLYYQNRAGVKFADSLSALVKCQVIYSFTSIIAYFVIVIVLAVGGFFIVFYGKTVSLWLVVSLGLIFHIAVFGCIILLAFIKKLRNFLLLLWAKILLKLKRIQMVEEYVAEKDVKLDEYKKQLIAVFTRIHKYLIHFALYFIHMLILGTVQYVSYLLVSGKAFSISDAFVFYTLNLASAYITNLVPVPGGMGTSELLFPLVFASVIPFEIIGVVLILWRVSTYYLPIIINFIVFTFSCAFLKKKENSTINN